MGRKPKALGTENPNIVIDRIGKETDLSSCPKCPVYGTIPDCFACINGHCTALKEIDETKPCPFYKSVEENTADIQACYKRLKEKGRLDLISRYIKPLTALGALDEEIHAEEQCGDEFDAFRESNFQEQMNKAMENGLDEDLLDDDGDAEDDEGTEDGLNEPEDPEEEDDGIDDSRDESVL